MLQKSKVKNLADSPNFFSFTHITLKQCREVGKSWKEKNIYGVECTQLLRNSKILFLKRYKFVQFRKETS